MSPVILPNAPIFSRNKQAVRKAKRWNISIKQKVNAPQSVLTTNATNDRDR